MQNFSVFFPQMGMQSSFLGQRLSSHWKCQIKSSVAQALLSFPYSVEASAIPQLGPEISWNQLGPHDAIDVRIKRVWVAEMETMIHYSLEGRPSQVLRAELVLWKPCVGIRKSFWVGKTEAYFLKKKEKRTVETSYFAPFHKCPVGHQKLDTVSLWNQSWDHHSPTYIYYFTLTTYSAAHKTQGWLICLLTL